MKKRAVRCSECGHCRKFWVVKNIRSEFWCGHPEQEYIQDYFEEHGIKKVPGFLGFSKGGMHEIRVKTSPAWCPEKNV